MSARFLKSSVSCFDAVTVVVCLALPLAGRPARAAAPDPATAVSERIDCVRVSVKHVLSAAGERSVGYFQDDRSIRAAIDVANDVLATSGADWRLRLDEIVDVPGISAFHELERHDDMRRLEDEARRHPARYQWRFDAINFYVVHDLPAGGICSFPVENEIITINNSGGILNGGIGWLHEVGHYLSLTHTFQCEFGFCNVETCTGVAAYHGDGRYVYCADTCPDEDNVMSYERLSPGVATFSSCQLAEMAFELHDARGSRSHVVDRGSSCAPETPEPPAPPTAFRRGDADADGSLRLADAVRVFRSLFDGSALDCRAAADANGNGQLEITDGIHILDHLFRGGAAPAAPFPACGVDGSPGAARLGCARYEACSTRGR